MKTKTIPTIVSAALAFAGFLALSSPVRAQQSGYHRANLQRHDISVPGWEAVQVRVDIDPGMIVPKHKHPGEEIVYALHGVMEYRFQDKPPVTLKAGEVLFVPKGVVHSVKNVGDEEASEVSTYVVEKGKPLVEPVK